MRGAPNIPGQNGAGATGTGRGGKCSNHYLLFIIRYYKQKKKTKKLMLYLSSLFIKTPFHHIPLLTFFIISF